MRFAVAGKKCAVGVNEKRYVYDAAVLAPATMAM
jgi:hypothetical protein